MPDRRKEAGAAGSLAMMTNSTEKIVDWFVPPALRADADLRRRARLFVIGHLFGTPVGGILVAYIQAADPTAGARMWLLASGVAAFLLYPLALRLTGWFDVLALLSMEHLTLVILFGAYHYGGATSPFLPWLVPIPIIVVLHFGPRLAPRALVLAALAAQLFAFFLLDVLGAGFPTHIASSRLAAAGIFSVLGAITYVAIMALYYSETIVEQQAELRHEVLSHRKTATELRDARDEAEQASLAKSKFLANMSHELRTPLNAIIGFSEIIGSEMLGPVGTAQYAAYSKDIARSGMHLLKMIGDILDLARIETGSFTLAENEFDLVTLVEMTARQLQPLAELRGITAAVSAPVRPIHLRGDEPRVKQIVINLMSNAVKFTERGGSVRTAITQDAQRRIIVKVTDTGVGIPPADMHRIMLPFEQGQHTTERATGGTGLGLPLARELAVRHGGTLTLESELGRGTTAIVTFPAERAIARPRQEEPVRQYPPKSA
jgi:signal transduction histidine kinase